ncbi:hypothetical protein AL755_05055 [Arthrobacter sp. ERGS1:01]|uniref:TetR/AcrR family transcriptional regulator n=1 Tax=Arthrobacter sp. ERGS1:01 TaxID=1704044 RepID=UPI0006B5B785|nr:TetR/AcrR family transcriptional regulator [Arthrobacter sp. ERGS1:01]ALE05004.1 hypothetical protein AL755_05055 [Arthrobacter sp. ERGS1:01]
MNQQRRAASTTTAQTSAGTVPPGRRYSGLGSDERARERRERLLEAGIEIFGTSGYAGSKVRELCQCAGLSERYFYESFESRHELLAGVYNHLANHLFEITQHALDAAGDDIPGSARAGLGAFMGFLLDDPRYAQIVLIEVVGVSAELEALRFDVLSGFSDMVLKEFLMAEDAVQEQDESPAQGDSRVPADFSNLTAVALVGAVHHVLVDALLSGRPVNKPLVIDVCLQLFADSRNGLARLRE